MAVEEIEEAEEVSVAVVVVEAAVVVVAAVVGDSLHEVVVVAAVVEEVRYKKQDVIFSEYSRNIEVHFAIFRENSRNDRYM